MNTFYYNVENRLQSFPDDWPHRSAKLSPKVMAENGFYYAGNSDSPDNVRCFACAKELEGWEEDDVVIEQHQRRTMCEYVEHLRRGGDSRMSLGLQLRIAKRALDFESHRLTTMVAPSSDKIVKYFMSAK